MKQRCWAHLLRDIHELEALYPKDPRLRKWAKGIRKVYFTAKAFSHPGDRQRRQAQGELERRLQAYCRPFLEDASAVQRKLCRRIEGFIKELFVFVAYPEVPPDNNAAERSLRPLVTSRKISGGTRSGQGTGKLSTPWKSACPPTAAGTTASTINSPNSPSPASPPLTITGWVRGEGPAGADPSTSAGDETCPFPAGHGTHAFSLSTRDGPSLSPPRNDSPPSKQLP